MTCKNDFKIFVHQRHNRCLPLREHRLLPLVVILCAPSPFAAAGAMEGCILVNETDKGDLSGG